MSATTFDPTKASLLPVMAPSAKMPAAVTGSTRDKVEQVSLSIFDSYLFSMGLKVAGALVFTAIAIGLCFATSPIMPVVFCVIIAVAIVFECIALRKELLFEITFLYINHKYKNDLHWSDTIIKDRLVLGAIPIENHLTPMKNDGITTVLSMVEDFELTPGLVHPVSTSEWKANNIEGKQIATADYFAVPTSKINEGVEFLHKQIQGGNKVYVHCKAGVGRSAAIVTSYLLKYGTNDAGKRFAGYDEAYAYVKGKRPQVNLNPSQRKSIENFIKEYPPIA